VKRQTAVNIVVGVESDLRMPSLKGLPLQAALAQVKELGLQAEDPTFTPSAEFEGRVIDHTPPAEARVRPGDGVVLLVGSAPRVAVPDLRGMLRQEAEARLKDLGLRAGEPQFIEDGERVDRVIRQQPSTGAQLDPGGTVTLFIGRAPVQEVPRITVPDLRGTPLEAALDRLSSLQLNLSEASFQRDPDRAGQVLGQRPEAGAEVEKDSGVTVVVGSGVEATDVTSVVQLVARDPDVARQGLTAERLMEGLRRNQVSSVERLKEVVSGDESIGATFGVRDTANVRRLGRAFEVVISRLA
jgi:serine/threonine-protein kinase